MYNICICFVFFVCCCCVFLCVVYFLLSVIDELKIIVVQAYLAVCFDI